MLKLISNKKKINENYNIKYKSSAIFPIYINQNIKNKINHINGHVITVITPKTFSIAVQSNGILNPIAGITFDVFYGSKRMFIPIELIYIQPEIA